MSKKLQSDLALDKQKKVRTFLDNTLLALLQSNKITISKVIDTSETEDANSYYNLSFSDTIDQADKSKLIETITQTDGVVGFYEKPADELPM